MSQLQGKTKSKAKNSNNSNHSGLESGSALVIGKKSSINSRLSPFYSAGPALTLNGPDIPNKEREIEEDTKPDKDDLISGPDNSEKTSSPTIVKTLSDNKKTEDTNISSSSPMSMATMVGGGAEQIMKDVDPSKIRLPEQLQNVEPMGEMAGKEKAISPVKGAKPGEKDEASSADGKASSGADIGKDTALKDESEAIKGLSTSMKEVSAIASVNVSFAPAKEEKASDTSAIKIGRERRARVDSLATSFLSHNTSKLQNIGSMGRMAPTRIKAAAERSKSSIDAAIKKNRATLSNHIVGVRAQAKKEAATSRNMITGQHLGSVTKIKKATKDGLKLIESKHEDSVKKLASLEKDQIKHINDLYNEGDKNFRKVGPKIGNEAIAIGQRRRQEYLSQRNGESDILDGPLHDNRLEAKADASVQVAEEYKKGLAEEADKQANEGQKGKSKDIATVREEATKSREALNSSLKAAKEGITQLETGVLEVVDKLKSFNLKAIYSNLASTIKSLSGQETAQLLSLTQYGERQKMAMDRDAASASASIVKGIDQSASVLKESFQSFISSAEGTEAPDQDGLKQLLTEMQFEIDSIGSDISEKIDTGVKISESGLTEGGSKSFESLNTLGNSGIKQASEVGSSSNKNILGLTKSATGAFIQMDQGHVGNIDTSVSTVIEGFTNVNKGIEKLFATNGENLENNFKETAKNLENDLREQGFKSLEKDITTNADKAAAEVQPRWKTVLKVVLIIAVVLVVAIVAGPAVIGFVGAAAGALGASAGAATVIGTIVGGAIVGAAAGAVIQLGSNVIDGKKNLWEGVGKAALVGAIAGAAGGAGASLAGAVGSSLGAIGQFALRGGINLAFDIGGGILGDLAVGNQITLGSVLLGAGIGLAAGGALSKLGKLGKLGSTLQGIQTKSFALGSKAGGAFGGGVRGMMGIQPKAPATSIETPSIKPAEPEAPAAKPAEPEAPAAKPAEPEVPAAKPVEPEAPAAKPAEPEAPATKPAEPEVPATKPAEPEAQAAKPAEPEAQAAKPAEPEVPAAKPAEPEAQAAKPAEPEVPAAKPAEPEVPAAKPAEPETLAAKPAKPEAPAAKPTEAEPQAVKPTETEPPAKSGTEAETKPSTKPSEAEQAAVKQTPDEEIGSVGGGQKRNVPLDKVRYSQDDVSPKTREGQSIEEVADNMRKNGWDTSKESPDMIDWGDGEFQTLDHRRLLAADQAKLGEVPANVHPANEPLPPALRERFEFRKTFTDPDTGKVYQKGELPETWGEAAMGRSAKQGPNFPLKGSKNKPVIRGR